MNHYALGVEVPPCSTLDLRRYAASIRRAINLPDNAPFPVPEFIEGVLYEVYDDFNLRVLTKRELGDKHGETFPDKHEICIREDVYIGMIEGNGQDRYTATHECSHLLKHEGTPKSMARRSAEKIERFRNSEWQADTLAAELLMPASVAKEMRPWEIESAFLVSPTAAEVRFSKLQKERVKYGVVRI